MKEAARAADELEAQMARELSLQQAQVPSAPVAVATSTTSSAQDWQRAAGEGKQSQSSCGWGDPYVHPQETMMTQQVAWTTALGAGTLPGSGAWALPPMAPAPAAAAGDPWEAGKTIAGPQWGTGEWPNNADGHAASDRVDIWTLPPQEAGEPWHGPEQGEEAAASSAEDHPAISLPGDLVGDPDLAEAFHLATGTFYDVTTRRKKPYYKTPPNAGPGDRAFHSHILPGMPMYENGARYMWQWMPRHATRGGKDLPKKNNWYFNYGWRFPGNYDQWGREI